jgi:hypothetical protein
MKTSRLIERQMHGHSYGRRANGLRRPHCPLRRQMIRHRYRIVLRTGRLGCSGHPGLPVSCSFQLWGRRTGCPADPPPPPSSPPSSPPPSLPPLPLVFWMQFGSS